MSKQEILEGNKIIAEFMGLINYKGTTQDLCEYPWKGVNKRLKYHSSWDWLMSVVEKINTLGIDNFGNPCFTIFSNKALVYDNDSNGHFINYTPDDGKLIDAVWLTVVEFIKWYNKR